MVLSSGATGSASLDAGLIIERGDDINSGIIWDELNDHFAMINTTEDGSTSGNINVNSYAKLKSSGIILGTSELDENALNFPSAGAIPMRYFARVIKNHSNQFELAHHPETPLTLALSIQILPIL